MNPLRLSRSGIVAICAIVAFVGGLGSGLALGSRKPAPTMIGNGSSVGSSSIRTPVPLRPAELASEAEAEAEVEPPADANETAQGLWVMMTSKTPERPSQTDRRMRLRQLSPDMAEFFICKFREAKADDERQMALDMAIGCGGAKAAALIEELISEPITGELDINRINLTAFLLGNGHSRRPRDLPVSESLLIRTRILQDSPSKYDRSLAVTILGYDDSARANAALMVVLQSDPDPWVRQTSIMVMGRIGDESVLRYLADNRDKIALELHSLFKPPPSPGGAPVVVLSKYHFATTIDDAIAELVERLRKK